MTTIGYGILAPSTPAGKVIIVVGGLIGITVGATCLGVLITTLDDFLNTIVGLHRKLPATIAPPARLHLCKWALAVLLLLANLAAFAWFGLSFCSAVAPDGPSDMLHAFYFAFQTAATVGFGDVTCDERVLTHVVLQVIVILPSMVIFSEYANLSVEGLSAVMRAAVARPLAAVLDKDP